MLRLLVGFLPWIVVGALGEHSLVLALVLALGLAAVTTFRQFTRGALKILDTVTLAFFLCMVVAVVGFGWMTPATYMSLLVNVTLMAIAWGSLLAGVPFTVQYAREQVAPEFWHTAAFLRVNQVITAVWGLYFFVCALISVYRRLSGDSGFAWSYAWVALALLATLFTARFPAWYRTRALRAAPQGAPPGGD